MPPDPPLQIKNDADCKHYWQPAGIVPLGQGNFAVIAMCVYCEMLKAIPFGVKSQGGLIPVPAMPGLIK